MINRLICILIIAATVSTGISSAFAQNRQLSDESDTTFWFPRLAQICDNIGIPMIEKSLESNEIRFWDEKKVIRLCGSGDTLRGEVIYFLQRYDKADPYNRFRQGKVYFERVPLSKRAIRAISYLIADFEIDQIPTDKQIEGWPEGNDLDISIIESCTPETFSFRTYGLPIIWLKTGRNVSYFFEQLSSIEEIEKGYEQFIAKQPFGVYHKGMSTAELGFSSFFSRWGFRIDRKLFSKRRDRKHYQQKALANGK